MDFQLSGAHADLSAATYVLHHETHTLGNALRWMLTKKWAKINSLKSRRFFLRSLPAARRSNFAGTGQLSCSRQDDLNNVNDFIPFTVSRIHLSPRYIFEYRCMVRRAFAYLELAVLSILQITSHPSTLLWRLWAIWTTFAKLLVTLINKAWLPMSMKSSQRDCNRRVNERHPQVGAFRDLYVCLVVHEIKQKRGSRKYKKEDVTGRRMGLHRCAMHKSNSRIVLGWVALYLWNIEQGRWRRWASHYSEKRNDVETQWVKTLAEHPVMA